MTRYAGFLSRFAAGVVDLIALWPLMALSQWTYEHSYTAALLLEIPITVGFALYSIYCIGRWGQTPGKMALRIKVVALDGTDAGYFRALKRHSVDLVCYLITSVLSIYALLSVTAAEYDVASLTQKEELVTKNLPPLVEVMVFLSLAWAASEMLVLLLNAKHRAIHDFIAGTVVVHLEGKPVAV